MQLTFHLGNENPIDLTYRLFENSFTKRFYNRFKDQANTVQDRELFYNFGDTLEDAQLNLDEIINKLNDLEPGLIQGESDLNRLHENFPNMVAEATGEKFKLLCKFNDAIHRLENKHNFPQPHWIMMCDGDPGEPLLEEDYELFTLERKWGYLYMNYPHVGKHYAELAMDDDIDVPEEHIMLTNIMRNGFFAWFGGNIPAEPRMLQCAKFYPKIKNKVPYMWGDPHLSIGYLPLGVLETTFTEHSVFKMIKYNTIIKKWSFN